LSKYWKIPLDENAGFVAAMEDILEVYKRPDDARSSAWTNRANS
jgi:hypothetical protein